MVNHPSVSIITVVYNGEKFIEGTILSVLKQTYANIEYIIIDGGSTDGTLDIIKKYEDKINYWISEKDNGIYEAMNKGLEVATGDYIAILNADDYYIPDAIALSIEKLMETKSDYCFANVEYVDNGAIIKPIYPLEKNYIYQEMPYPHVSAVISASVYRDVGLFDTAFKIAGDHDMALRIHLKGYKAAYINEVVAKLEAGGISSGIQSNRESYLVAVKNGKNHMSARITYLKQLVKLYILKILPTSITVYIQKLKGSRFK